MSNYTKFADAKLIIRQGIEQGISFEELRLRLPDWRKRPLQCLIFDVMDELGIENMPFSGIISRPRLSRPGIQVKENGELNIAELLIEKGFIASECTAYPHIGKNKITLTIKSKKICK